MKDILIKYKLIIIPGIPLLFFLILTTLLFTSDYTSQTIFPAPTTSPSTDISREFPAGSNIKIREEMEGNIKKRPGLQKTEVIQGNITKYIFISKNKDRPNVIIAEGTEEILFQRTITLPGFPVKITNYTNVYGSAKWIFKGSNFYGPDAQTYIYPERGFAFIANPKTNEVLELHTFQPTKVEDYVKKYGDDIPSYP